MNKTYTIGDHKFPMQFVIAQLVGNESTIAFTNSNSLALPLNNSQHPSRESSLFAATESALGNFHYVCAAYVLPVVVAFGFVQNGWAAYVLARLTNGIGKTARVYYVSLALADMGNLLALLVLFWLSLGLQFATGGAVYLQVRSRTLSSLFLLILNF